MHTTKTCPEHTGCGTFTYGPGDRHPMTDNTVSAEVAGSVRAALDSIVLSEDGQTVINDIRTSPYTLAETMYLISQAQGRWPGYEIFMDGDSYAVVARRRRC